ncbi:ADP-heptose--LPS heptosyltransferase [Endozoicomonas montiporae]|uniref:Lipopolysaccharide heptosyltransferase 1 n=2 Tax=Endozoicomonas montiporae TaxID=1027273 RepID=A0A081MZH6_9GAMM|nr:lipopolysaccharide heptosyltransferase I [Endozoicomonas montiporae]AMO54719.1 heptosyltransferase I [Endozoicomonas montiporae CL-33]KEQ11599.1 ADP-heptose--LPS heptosyltransferase [Endozoicomonas montiporae]
MKVLIIKTSSMGDVIHTLPALTDAANAIQGIRFDWVVEEGFAEIPSWHPAVDKVIPVAIRRWRKSPLKTLQSGEWKRFKALLKSRRYDAVIDAQGLVKSAFLTRIAKGPKFGLDKHSAREPLASTFYKHPQSVPWHQHAVERVRQLFALSLGYSVPQTTGHFQLDKSHFRSDAVTDNPYVVFIHGTTWPTKHWPEKYWCELAQRVNDAGYDVVLPWGSEKEKERAEIIARSSKSAIVLPRMNICAVAGVIARAKAVTAVDTGLGHLTAALEIPAVSLYGPTSPELVGAYGQSQIHLTLDDCPEIDKTSVINQNIEPEMFIPMTPDFVWSSLQPLLSETPDREYP